MKFVQCSSAAIASAAIAFGAATVAASAAEPTVVALAPPSASLYKPARIKAPIDTIVPPIAAIMGLSGKAVVQVDLDERGRVIATYVATSSGNATLDAAACKTVASGTYAPATVGGTPVLGSFLVTVDFGTGA